MKYYYYEIIGGILFELDPAILFVRTRDGSIPLYRQLMMYYRRMILKMSLRVSSGRYNLNHATCVHAVKTVQNMRDTDPIFREMSDTFFKSCKREQEFHVEDVAKELKAKNMDKSYIESILYKVFDRYNRLQYYISMAMKDNGDSNVIEEMIDSCRNDLSVLSAIFSETSNNDTDGSVNKGDVGESRD